jgi:hypothetical protein
VLSPGHEERALTCRRCGRQLDPRVSRYAVVVFAWRGRGRCREAEGASSMERAATYKSVFCGTCAAELADGLAFFVAGAASPSSFFTTDRATGLSLRRVAAAGPGA